MIINKLISRIFFLLLFCHLFGASLVHAQIEAKTLEPAEDEEMTEEEFKTKLSEMYNRINKSLKILRDQITANQSAPFLANLYMQLGDMLTQKSNVLYYIKMEGSQGEVPAESGDAAASGGGGGSSDVAAEKKFKDVVDATKEAIIIYEKILKEFPKFPGRSRAMYQLALALKSIDEPQKFLMVVNDLIKAFPGTKDGVKGELLLGQHVFERGIFDEALKTYMPVSKTKFPFERNQAKYKMGIIKITEEKHKEALDLFVEVITDKEFLDDDNDAEVNLKKKNVKSNLKREALVDSVRAYTEVYKVSDGAVKFYSNIAPTENLFQEVIEKLAFRYINLKQYGDAIKLLRTLTERTSSPEKVLSIYKEVLLMIPLNDRVTLPVSEIRYVLEKFVQWKNFYKLSPEVRRSSDDFFEKQLRDLGTRSHEMGKEKKEPAVMAQYLKNATDFYELYIALIPKGPNTMKMALNSGDSFFRLGDFMRCGDYYLRAYKGEFGKVLNAQKGSVIKNAVFCLQKEKEYSFYELRRVKGLLIESLKLLMEIDPTKRNDPKTNFTLAKAIYDQGFYTPALPRLVEFMKKYPNTPYATDAANLILDYFNIKSDYQGLMEWGGKILALNLPNQELNAKVKEIREQAKYKKLQAQVETSSSFDGFAQGKSYLANAANIQNVELRNLALSKALEASKREKDVETFMGAAKSIAAKEPDATKRAEVELSMAQEHLKMANYVEAKELYSKISSGSGYPEKSRQTAYTELVTMSVALRDWDQLAQLTNSGNWSSVSGQVKQQLSDLAGNALESPIAPSSSLLNVVRKLNMTPLLALGLFKASQKVKSLSGLSNSATSNLCSSSAGAAVCRWNMLTKVDQKARSLLAALGGAADLAKMEGIANQYAGVLQDYTSLEGSEDAALDIMVSLRQANLYAKFGMYLSNVAKTNAQVAQILSAKANESMQTAKAYKNRCKKIIESTGLISSINKSCLAGSNPTISDALIWGSASSPVSIKRVSKSELSAEKKSVFSVYAPNTVLPLATALLKQGAFHYAAAASVYGLSLGSQQPDFNTILGCSVLQLGYLSEAGYYLKNGSDIDGHKSKCLSRLRAMAK